MGLKFLSLVLVALIFSTGCVIPVTEKTPNEHGSLSVERQINFLGLPLITSNVQFRDRDTLDSQEISELVGSVDDYELCVLLSDNTPSRDSFDDSTTLGTSVIYDSGINITVDLLTLCDSSDEIQNSLEAYGLYVPAYFSLGDCSTLDSSSTTDYCIVVIQ